MPRLHADELPVDVALVRQLVDRAFPEYVEDGLRAVHDSGSSNALFRLGKDKLVRLPRQPGGGASIDKESSWLPYVAPRVTAGVPAIVGIGEPDLEYPERWANTTWLHGTRPSPPRRVSEDNETDALARDLAQFLAELRGMEVPEWAKEDEALSWYRGLPLWEVDPDFREAAAACRDLGVDLDIDEALRVWDRAADGSRAVEHADDWYHGDLLVENLLLNGSGGLAAVIDFGGLAIGDPTVDLVVAWEALDDDGRRVFRRTLDVDDDTWTASRGWALFIAMMTFPYYGTSMPLRCAALTDWRWRKQQSRALDARSAAMEAAGSLELEHRPCRSPGTAWLARSVPVRDGRPGRLSTAGKSAAVPAGTLSYSDGVCGRTA